MVAEPSLHPCPWCEQGHRQPVPQWALEAIPRYERGERPAALAREYGVSRGGLARWVRHADVQRSRDEALELRGKNAKTRDMRPTPCKCGCGRMTSGVPFWVDGQPKWPEWIAGHKERMHGSPHKSSRTLEGVAAPRWANAVRDRLQRLNRSFRWLAATHGIYYNAIFSPYRPRPETVIKVARALDADLWGHLRLAGYAPVGPISRSIFQRLADGYDRSQIREELGVGVAFVDEQLRGKRTYHRRETIDRLTPILGLSEAEAEEERRRSADWYAHSAEHVQAIRRKRPWKSRGGPWKRLWAERRTEMAVIQGQAAAARRIDVDPSLLRTVLEDVETYVQAAERLHEKHGIRISPAAVKVRAVNLGLQSRAAGDRAYKRQERRTRPARRRRHEEATLRRQAAEEYVAAWGPRGMGYRELAHGFGIRAEDAAQILASARRSARQLDAAVR